MWFVEWIFLDLMCRKWGKSTKKIQLVLKLDTDCLGQKKSAWAFRRIPLDGHLETRQETESWEHGMELQNIICDGSDFVLSPSASTVAIVQLSQIVSAMSSTTTGFAKVHTTTGKSTLDKGWLDSLNTGCSTLRVTGPFSLRFETFFFLKVSVFWQEGGG